MFEALDFDLERGGQVEDLRPVLDGRHPAGGERLAVAGAIDLIEDRHGRIARTNEIAVQRVADTLLDRAIGRQQRLADDQAAEDARPLLVRRQAAEQVHLDPLERQGLDQIFGFGHAAPLARSASGGA